MDKNIKKEKKLALLRTYMETSVTITENFFPRRAYRKFGILEGTSAATRGKRGGGPRARGHCVGALPRPRNNNSGDNVSQQIAQSVNQHKHR